MFGEEWRWRRNGGYGFVKLELGAHRGLKAKKLHIGLNDFTKV